MRCVKYWALWLTSPVTFLGTISSPLSKHGSMKDCKCTAWSRRIVPSLQNKTLQINSHSFEAPNKIWWAKYLLISSWMKISQGNKYLGLAEKFWTFFPYVFWYIYWSFQGRDTKLERFLAKNQLYSNEISKFWKLE